MFGNKKIQEKKEEAVRENWMNLYVIYDVVKEECGPVVEAVNDASALREYHGVMEKVPEKSDYSLVRVGKIDKVSMKIETMGPLPVYADLKIEPEKTGYEFTEAK